MMQQLPEVLEHEPLVHAPFEVRLNGTVSLTDILPSFFYLDLEPKPTMIRLAAVGFPQPFERPIPGSSSRR